MSCTRMENKILPYVDGRLKEGERLEMEKHLAACPACRLRANEFRAVSSFLDELPEIEPSGAFDARVRARVAAEPAKQSWLVWLTPSPRVALAASLLVMATVWVASRPYEPTAQDEAQINQNLPILENYDVLSDFGALTELPQPVQSDDSGNTNPDQEQNQDQDQDQGQSQSQTM
jgi:negative regulator of sigma E activity